MRFLVKAKADNPPPFGERVFTKADGKPLQKGDEIEISGQWFEAVNSRQYLEISDGGAFEKVREIPEFDHERRNIEKRERLAALEEKTKDELLKEADKMDLAIPRGALKDEVLESVTVAVDAKIMEEQKQEMQETSQPPAATPKKGGKR